MALMEIVTWPNPILDLPGDPVTDFGDDLIRIFMNSASGKLSPVTKNGFDQHFRRLQAHGTRRLIVFTRARSSSHELSTFRDCGAHEPDKCGCRT